MGPACSHFGDLVEVGGGDLAGTVSRVVTWQRNRTKLIRTRCSETLSRPFHALVCLGIKGGQISGSRTPRALFAWCDRSH